MNIDQMNKELESFRYQLEDALNNGQVEQAIGIMTELRKRNVDIPISIEIPDYPVNSSPSYQDPPYQNLSQARTQQFVSPQSYNSQQHQLYSSSPSMGNAPSREEIKSYLVSFGLTPIDAQRISKQAKTIDQAIDLAQKIPKKQ
ncbi:unnamed protein product [Blepharisma stoltei]|uniref:UBA domain-containing protein n=1 Tax=Blepharisma stoltei TaxID=1481888 RepID=A0AAU9IUI8_9CILI|nr:unnamed protein product [Blepharisma stoltei]